MGAGELPFTPQASQSSDWCGAVGLVKERKTAPAEVLVLHQLQICTFSHDTACPHLMCGSAGHPVGLVTTMSDAAYTDLVLDASTLATLNSFQRCVPCIRTVKKSN
jgi:hypothetical protein